MAGVTAEPDSGRPDDIDTGFWLWVVALPLLVIGQLVDLVGTRDDRLPWPLLAVSVVLLVVLASVVVTFQILMRHGYRWARTVLTGGGLASVVYVTTSLFGEQERPPSVAVTYAVTAILGSVLIVGGVYLLHRKDAHAYFTR